MQTDQDDNGFARHTCSSSVELSAPVNEVYTKKVMVESHPGSSKYWKTNFKTEVGSGSGRSAEAMPWIQEGEVANFNRRSQDIAVHYRRGSTQTLLA